ncbi:MAG: sigma-70 family RNA polymerase sigma factor [Bacteroidales bacterium]|nr:sigma-70 family RNA polymerase sigma factor [Bacteroidales bacterium]
MVETDDYSIIKRIRLGDVELFSVLVDRYQETIYRLTYHMTGNQDEAKDLAQEIFVKAYTNLDKVDFQHKFFSWLYRIAVNESLTHLARKRPVVFMEDMKEADVENTSDRAREAEEKKWVRRAVLQLQPKYRILVVMKYYSGMSYGQISTIAGITEKKVKSRLFEARQILRNLLTEQMD